MPQPDYPASTGALTIIGRTRFQSRPSSSAISLAWFSCTRTALIRGQQNADFSNRLAKRQTPLPSHQTILILSARFARNT